MASKPSLDDRTANAIRQSIAAASSGRIDEACLIGERALAGGGDVAALNAMLGMLRGRSGDVERAADHLAAAHRERPGDPVIAHNLVQALMELGRNAEALDILNDRLVAADRDGRLLRLRAFLAQSLDRNADAAVDYEAIVAAAPGDWESWNNLGNARRALDDFDGAIAALRKAAHLAPDSAPTRFNLASSLSAAGRFDEAEAAFDAMAADFPDDPKPLRELHALYKDQGQDDRALQAIADAVARAPNDVELLLGYASHLSQMLRTPESQATYERVLAIEPDNPLAHIGIAFCLDLTNRTEDLSALVRSAAARGVEDNALNFIRAFDFRRTKDFAAGLAALQQVPSELETARRANLLGQLLEGVGRYDEAFQAYTQMNALMREQSPFADDRAAEYRAMIRSRTSESDGQWFSSWREESAPDPRPAPVFLFGFPRSGTTLLDTMLMGHPQIEVLEEERTLQKAFEHFSSYSALADASDAEIAAARDAYFAAAKEKTPLAPGHLLVDKNPLAINAVPIMKRLFPEAKLILALRHPLDVLLSCFVTNFRLNDGMASFTRLDTAAELYDLSFSYFTEVQSHLQMPVHHMMYEKVVADRDRALRDLFDFLELDWDDAVLDHETTARKRGRIKTASYAQVVEPIYSRSAGRWEHFRKHLEPIIPTVRPWIDTFGYET